ncbi:hypothetical protein [Enterococcus gallinarum]|uniref:Phage tail protein n=1 Tax=Enterococcus gallinarum TaxID=1353 RepID=A0ABD4ZX58_ENTGA|nr:hypothetical protein [Enterococcus gallinarum]MDL4876463.1 hypothetical protein [Enterococcus gallinarum]MDL4882965.1 hypothetical protein [Enterococcus gallinarum]MDL4886511.1 hypothetical protein [Enterococcus gallinarum]MDL4895240.1 hypothetical protein [Enterococcus gallinarum]MDL4922022.1 hypothetical protein [Enterococcus gallinarum]
MVKQWKNEDIIYPEDAQRWEDGLEDAKQNNSQNATNLKSHTDNKSNPHGVTAAQTGAYTKAEADSKDAAVLTSAKSYTDLHSVKKDNPHGVTAGQTGAYTKAEADERDASTLSAAKSYSDTKKTEATTYTDQKVATAKSEIQSGSVASANKLTTARKIAGIDFDGTKDISIPANNVGAYTKAEADSKVATAKTEIQSGNVASATKLQNTRTINGVSFDGTSNISITANPTVTAIPTDADLNNYQTAGDYVCALNTTAATLKNSPTAKAFGLEVVKTAGVIQRLSVYDDSTMYVRKFYRTWGSWIVIPLANGVMQTGLYSQSASKLAAARTISLSGSASGSVSFDGSGNVTLPVTLTGNAPTATSATKLSTARTIALSGGATGSASFDGSGNVSIATTLAGNAPSATKLATARTISLTGGVTGSASFNGTANASIATTIAGNAPTATKLQTARTIAGVSFDGTSNIAIAAGNVGAYTKAEVDAKIVDVQSPSWVDVSKYLSSSFRLYSGSEGSKIKVQVANKGTLIISGIVSPTKVLNFPNNTQEYDLVSIPKSVLGVSGSWSICPIIEQASGAQVWLLGMEDNGTNLIFKMSRHRYGTSWTNCNAGDWLPFTGIVRLG